MRDGVIGCKKADGRLLQDFCVSQANAPLGLSTSQPHPAFTEDAAKKRKDPASRSCMEEKISCSCQGSEVRVGGLGGDHERTTVNRTLGKIKEGRTTSTHTYIRVKRPPAKVVLNLASA